MTGERSDHGTPLGTRPLTSADRRRQAEAERYQAALGRQTAKFPTRISAENAMRLAQLLGRPRRREPQFRWRVQLYCGHIAELTRPEDTARPDLEIRGETCPECHRRPSVIVAYELVGLDDGQPDARQVPAPQNPGVSRD